MKEFAGFAAFAKHLESLAAQAPIVQDLMLEKAADHIAKAAKDKIGHYQEAAGHFPEWEELADSTEYEKARLGYPVDAPLLRDGTMRDSIKKSSIMHAGGARYIAIGSESDIAVYQEQGTLHIPPRPFLGPAMFESKAWLWKMFCVHAGHWIAGVNRLPGEGEIER